MHLGFLNHNNYQIYNRDLARKLGSVHAAIFLSDLINRYEYHSKHSPKDLVVNADGTWFYYTNQCGVERLVLSREEQDTAVKILISYNLIKKKAMQLPAKRFFCINEDKILELFNFSKNVSSLRESHKLESGNPTISPYKEPYIKKPPLTPLGGEGERVCQPISTPQPLQLIFSIDKGKFEGITKEDMRDWKLAYPSISIEKEIFQAQEWLKSEPLKAKQKKKWRSFLTNWFKRSEKQQSRANKNSLPSQAIKCRELADGVKVILLRSGAGHLLESYPTNCVIKTNNRSLSIPFNMNPQEFKNILLKEFKDYVVWNE